MVDVGAYTGLFSLLTATLRPDVRAVALEPATVTFGRLVHNILWNGYDLQILPANLAAWDATEVLRLPHQFGIYSMSPGETPLRTVADHTQRVGAIPLDALLSIDDTPDYLNSRHMPLHPFTGITAVKIDVEGNEPRVLAGASRLLREERPVLIAEAWTADAAATQEAFLARHDYVREPLEGGNLWFCPAERHMALVEGYQAWCADRSTAMVLRGERILTWIPPAA
jgi:FkbM family methyltransferase